MQMFFFTKKSFFSWKKKKISTWFHTWILFHDIFSQMEKNAEKLRKSHPGPKLFFHLKFSSHKHGREKNKWEQTYVNGSPEKKMNVFSCRAS